VRILKQGSTDTEPVPIDQDACPIASNLDTGVRKIPLAHTNSSPPADSAVVRLRHETTESPLARRKNITSSPVHQRGELGVLQPLSPEHGAELSDQYDFLRRTLSHSRRRYSTRKRPHPRGRGQENEQTVERSINASQLFDASFGPVAQRGNQSSGQPSGQSSSGQPSGQSPRQPSGERRWRDILISTDASVESPRREGRSLSVGASLIQY